jgi:hypothetical protein
MTTIFPSHFLPENANQQENCAFSLKAGYSTLVFYSEFFTIWIL